MKRFLLLGCLIFFSVWTIAAPTNELYAQETEEQIYNAGKKALLKHNYEEATRRFETLNARYPFTRMAQHSQLNLIYVYYKNDQLPLSLATADQYIRLYPRGEDVDYAYYMRGVIQVEENKGVFEHYFNIDSSERDVEGLSKAYIDFKRVHDQFSKSPYGQAAQQYMNYIRYTLASHELKVAQFYDTHHAYVAAVNRASDLVKYYPDVSSLFPKAFQVLHHAYTQLGLTQEAEKAAHGLQNVS